MVNDPVELDFFVTDTEILCREMRCLLCRRRSSTQGSLKVSPEIPSELKKRTPPIKVVSSATVQRKKNRKELARR